MKKLLVITAALAAVVQSYGQGQFAFTTTGGTGVIWVGAVATGTKAGTGYSVDYAFYNGTTADPNVMTEAQVNKALSGTTGTFTGGTQTFGDGTGPAGTVTTTVTAGGVTLPSIAPGTSVSIQVRAWQTSGGATWALAQANGANSGASSIFSVSLSDPVSKATPDLPTAIKNTMAPFAIVASVPEPSTIALGVIGAAALLFRRRK